jgi:excisionase family DNA binding protein
MLPELLSLPEAARRVGVGKGTLRTAIRLGQLSCTRIGGRVYVTEQQLREMIDRCQQGPRDRDSTSEAGRAGNQPGSSETAPLSTAQAAARATVQALKERSPTTSRASTRQSRGKAGSPASPSLT